MSDPPRLQVGHYVQLSDIHLFSRIKDCDERMRMTTIIVSVKRAGRSPFGEGLLP